MKKLLFVIPLIIFLLFFITKKDNNENKIQGKNTIKVLDDYIVYLNIDEKYIENGAIGVDGENNNISDKISINYYRNNTQVFKIDTRFKDTYTVKYCYKKKCATKIVVIYDNIAPEIKDIETIEISKQEAISFDTKNGVEASDNSGKVELTCLNLPSYEEGEYVIKCTAIDSSLNKTEKNRLIKIKPAV